MESAPINTIGNTYVSQFTDHQQDDENLRIVLSKNYTNLATSLNYKTNGIHEVVETQTGSIFNNPANIRSPKYNFRQMAYFGPCAPGASVVVAINIPDATMFTYIGGSATTATDFRPVPHASVTLNANIEVIVTSTTITINNGSASPALLSGIVVLEYLKN
jgi:hypothetical protein